MTADTATVPETAAATPVVEAGDKRKAEDVSAVDDAKKCVDRVASLTSRQKTEDASADKGKGKAAAPAEDEEEEADDDDDDDDDDDELIVRGPRKRTKVDYTSVSVEHPCSESR